MKDITAKDIKIGLIVTSFICLIIFGLYMFPETPSDSKYFRDAVNNQHTQIRLEEITLRNFRYVYTKNGGVAKWDCTWLDDKGAPQRKRVLFVDNGTENIEMVRW